MGAADRDRKHARRAAASTLVIQRSELVERSWDWNVGDRDGVVNLVRDEFGADWVGGALSLEGYAAEATLRHIRTSLDNSVSRHKESATTTRTPPRGRKTAQERRLRTSRA